MKIVFFGSLTDITQCTQVEAPEVADTAELLSWLHEQFPALANASYMLALNREVVHDTTPVLSDSEIALLPPFSGG